MILERLNDLIFFRTILCELGISNDIRGTKFMDNGQALLVCLQNTQSKYLLQQN